MTGLGAAWVTVNDYFIRVFFDYFKFELKQTLGAKGFTHIILNGIEATRTELLLRIWI